MLNLVVYEATTGIYKVNHFGIKNYELQKEMRQCTEDAGTDNRVNCAYNNRPTTHVSVVKGKRRPRLFHHREWPQSTHVASEDSTFSNKNFTFNQMDIWRR